MKKKIALLIALAILILVFAWLLRPARESSPDQTTAPTIHQTDPANTETWYAFQDPAGSETISTDAFMTDPEAESETQAHQNESEKETQNAAPTEPTGASKPDTGSGNPRPTEPEKRPTQPKETEPPATNPPQKPHKETAPPVTEPPQTEPDPTEEETEPAVPEITYAFKREVAASAARYINQYRGSACTVLPGMSNVAQYRAGQLTYNFSHSTADKRAALAHFQYGRFVDATEFGDDPSNSYWEADSAEAICAGFYGTDADAMGKRIADLIRNSSGHWSSIGSSEYSYIGVGVEYREGTQYGWYACVMVGSVNYG